MREEETEFPILEKQGFLIGKIGSRVNISRINVHAAENVEYVKKYGGTAPCFVLLEGDKVLGKRVGFQTAKQLSAWFYSVPQAKLSPQYYPRRSGNWSGPVNNQEQAILHLLWGGEHRGKFTREMLHGLSLSELQALHSDDHERRVHWDVLRN